MPRPRLDLARLISDIAGHVEDLPGEAGIPILHLKRSTNDVVNLHNYLQRNIRASAVYRSVLGRHMARLRKMMLLGFCASFERFLKELAAVCVDHLGTRVLDDRLDELKVKGSAFAAHFGSGSLGSAMCESGTWLDCDQVNDRFRRLLSTLMGRRISTSFPKHDRKPPVGRSGGIEP